MMLLTKKGDSKRQISRCLAQELNNSTEYLKVFHMLLLDSGIFENKV